MTTAAVIDVSELQAILRTKRGPMAEAARRRLDRATRLHAKDLRQIESNKADGLEELAGMMSKEQRDFEEAIYDKEDADSRLSHEKLDAEVAAIAESLGL